MAKSKAIQYGVRTPEREGDFDRRGVVRNPGEHPDFEFGERRTYGMPDMSRNAINYYTGKTSSGKANYVKQKKMQGFTGGQGRGKDSFGAPKGSSSKVSNSGPMAKQKKGFGGQTTTQY